MNGSEVRSSLDHVLAAMVERADEFRRLDAAVGDGDLGITIGSGASAVRESLDSLPDGTSVAETVRRAGQVFAKANPSTFSTLVGTSLMRAAPALEDDPIDLSRAAVFTRAFLKALSAMGKSVPGDKTIVDALSPVADALDSGAAIGMGGPDALEAAITAAQRGVDESTPLVSKRGRARWLGERASGHPDPGAVALLRFLEAWRDESRARD